MGGGRLALSLALAFLAGAGLTWIVAAQGPARGARDDGAAGPGPPAHGPADPAGVEALLASTEARLDRIEEGIAELLAAGAGSAVRLPLPADGPDAPDATGVAELVRVLSEEVRRLADEAQEERLADRVSRIQDLKEAKPDADWTALQTILDLWTTDEEAARKEVQLLSEVEVLERYGTPDLLYGGNEDVHWVYGQGYEPETDSYRLQIVLHFQDGTVTSMWVEDD